jgi:capsid protein
MFEAIRALFSRKPIRERSFDAASGGRRWRDAGMTPSIQAAVLAGREPVARRARDASINQPLANSAVEVWTGEAIRTGMRPVPQTRDDALDKIIADKIEAWTDRADYFGLESFYGWQATAARRSFVDGEYFTLLVFEGDELRLKALDPAQVNPSLSLELPGVGEKRLRIERRFALDRHDTASLPPVFEERTFPHHKKAFRGEQY